MPKLTSYEKFDFGDLDANVPKIRAHLFGARLEKLLSPCAMLDAKKAEASFLLAALFGHLPPNKRHHAF